MPERVDQVFVEKYRKNPAEEAFLDRLNDILAPHEQQDYRDLPEAYPSLFIVGTPRSGTTLLTQLLAAHTSIGYVNNLIAAFWRAPVYGIRLSEKLMPRGARSTFESNFGRTRDISEPHEFGYFWSAHLGYKELRERQPGQAAIDWQRLRLVLVNMQHAFRSPVMFKAGLLGWHIRDVHGVLSKSCWIYVNRDPIQTALSLLEIRERFLGSIHKWASLKPLEYSWLQDEPPWRQVAGQVYYLHRRYTEQLAAIDPGSVLTISYRELCQAPEGVLHRIRSLIETQGGKLDIVGQIPAQFEERTRPVDGEIARRIAQAWQEMH